MTSPRFAFPASPAAASAAGFVACPVAVLAVLSPGEQAHVAEIYRIARERSAAAVASRGPWTDSRVRFSAN